MKNRCNNYYGHFCSSVFPSNLNYANLNPLNTKKYKNIMFFLSKTTKIPPPPPKKKKSCMSAVHNPAYNPVPKTHFFPKEHFVKVIKNAFSKNLKRQVLNLNCLLKNWPKS